MKSISSTELDLTQVLRPGDRIIWGQACGEPTTLIEALIAQAPQIGPLSAFAATSFSGVLDETAADRLSLASMGAIGLLRKLTALHKLQVIPCQVSTISALIEQGLIGCDVAFVQVSPPDAAGNHSYGLIADFVHTAVMKARLVIAEVNSAVPFTHSDVTLPASRIDLAVHVARPPVQVSPARIGETDQRIAELVAHFIEDEATLQVGIGAVPDAILRLLHNRRDLGFHSGMLGDAAVDLLQSGVVTNASKPIDAGISTTTALIGTQRLYDFAHNNPSIAVRSSNYIHNASVLARIPKFVTINSAVEVDLTGQVNAEQSGPQYVGGTGGQLDFVRAGSRSQGGHSIIALPSTAKRGTISRITHALTGPVTTARSDVDVIVTEFGAAELRGQSIAERTRRLIAIAHPEFREELERAAYPMQKAGF